MFKKGRWRSKRRNDDDGDDDDDEKPCDDRPSRWNDRCWRNLREIRGSRMRHIFRIWFCHEFSFDIALRQILLYITFFYSDGLFCSKELLISFSLTLILSSLQNITCQFYALSVPRERLSNIQTIPFQIFFSINRHSIIEMDAFTYSYKEAELLDAEPLVRSEPYEIKSSWPRNFWRLVSWVFNLIAFVVICILSTKLAMKVNVGMDLACLQLQSAWCRLNSTINWFII